ncbi:trypsin-like peptidase domain-containing protein [Janthinobacterium sp. GW460P]|uniref:S1 family peptidase n=1 Tax=unclassified Janthinobacterium TaxID=2610881 RepID=UPI000A325BF2|nr:MULTISPECIES: serine protease [unclassified Janthinobacterium]MCC7703055.1 trypsin-like peptidase domain-containing protein [Janthinobacterium sp. GW460P]MCC7708562.1 trypsin-like peptidase domain-containing protein [Janthinobacterium sp. GW460W]
MKALPLTCFSALLFCLPLTSAPCRADAPLAQTIARIKPSIVGVGSLQKTRTPPMNFIGTGFVAGDGLSVLTCAHVIQKLLDANPNEVIGILTGQGEAAQFRPAKVQALDTEHDLALLRLAGTPLPALALGDAATVREGQAMAFTGFPLGTLLGLHHVTHRATVSSLTPVVMPSENAQRLDVRRLAQLQKAPYTVFQLDATAYPGSSGSPLFDPETGLVYGIVNMVYVKGLKEAAISAPSGITYAIPGGYMQAILLKNK